MKAQKLAVGNTQIKNNVFLAPMAGYTDYAFRSCCENSGFGLKFTELVSAKGLFFAGDKSGVLLKTDNYGTTAAQIFGSDPYYMRLAVESEKLAPFNIVDINMGCPVPKVFKNGEGSALLADRRRAEEIIKECVKSGKNVTVKIRTGLKKGDNIAAEFAKAAEGAGAKLLTVHGRVREDYYSGEPDYKAIADAKKAVKIPVIANGGIFTEKDADDMMERTGADGVMLARGAIADPFLAGRILGKPAKITLKEFILNHISNMKKIYPDKRATLEFRKFVPYYFRGMSGIKDIKLAIYSAQNTEEIIKLIKKL